MERFISIIAAVLALAVFGVGTACVSDQPQKPQTPAEISTASLSQSPADRALLDEGKKVFDNQCARCHSVDGTSNMPGVDLSDYGSNGWTDARVRAFVANARRYRVATTMPPFAANVAEKPEEALSEHEIDAATAYVQSLKEQAVYLHEEAKSK